MLETEHAPVPFDLQLRPDRERIVLVASGELDLESAPRMAAAITEQFDNGFVHVVADLRDLAFIDSTGIRALWQAHGRAQREGLLLSLIPGQGDVGRALRMTGLLERMSTLEG
jgi:anti-anti-sigma factor